MLFCPRRYRRWYAKTRAILRSATGFSLIELIITVGIIAVMAAIVMVAVGPQTLMVRAKDAYRAHHEDQVHMGLMLLAIAGETLSEIPRFPTVEGIANTIPICKANVTRDTGCVILKALVDMAIMPSLPQDSTEPCPSYTGYEVYLSGVEPTVVATHKGKLGGDTLTRRCLLDTLAPDIFNVSHTLFASTASITWETDELADNQVQYGPTTAYGNNSTLNSSMQTLHNELLSGLLPYTTYHYRVLSRDAAGNRYESEDGTFVTDDTVAPVIPGVPVAVVNETSATITWTTDEPSDSQIYYGLTSAYGDQTPLDTNDVTSHSQTITGLTNNTTYHFQVRSRDPNNNLTQSVDLTFTTLPDTTPPTITNLSTVVSGNDVTISWTTNEASDTQVGYGTTTSYGSLSPLDTAMVVSHSVTITGLSLDTLYHYHVLSSDAAGNLGDSGNRTVSIVDTTAPVISGISSSALTYQGATVTWTTDEGSTSQIEYGLTTSYGNSSTLSSAFVTSHSQSLTGLSFSTTYHYRILSRDAAGNTSVSANQTFTTSNVISAVTVTGLSANGATVNWTTATLSDTQVQYGTTVAMPSNTALDGVMRTTGHTRTITGLLPNTLYYYRAKSVDAQLNLAQYDGTFTTNPDTTAPVISSVAWTNLTTTSPTVTWNTNEVSDTQVEYGLTSAYGTPSSFNGAMVTSHTQGLTGLTTNTTYYYRILSRDAAGNLRTSAGTIYIDSVAPVLTLPPTISGLTGNAATITWSVNESSAAQVDYGLTTAYGSPPTAYSGLTSPSQSRPLTGLTANTTYNYRVRSRDVAGNITVSGNYTFVTDVTAPVISAVASSAIGDTVATITWTTNEASDTRVEYGPTTAYGSSTTVGALVTSHSQGLSDLLPSTQYHYRVKSMDAAGNLATSANQTLTTTDTTAPTFSAITANVTSDSAATITWTTNESSTTQVEYGTTTAYGIPSSINYDLLTSHSQGISGLASNTTYHYRVKSRDAAGNLGTSSDGTFSTGDETPPIISSVFASNISSNGATINWTTNEASDTQVEYGTTTGYGTSTTLNASMVTSHVQAVSGLLPTTLYHYRVKSRDAAGNLRTGTDQTFTTSGDTTPPIISSVASATNATTITATITWTTNESSTTQVDYGTTTGYGSQTTLDSALVTSHSQVIAGLSPNVQYHYRVRSKDASDNEAVSTNGTFTIVDTTPPVITAGPTVPAVTATTVTVEWTTDKASNTQIEYGPTITYDAVVVDAAFVTNHSYVIPNLLPNVTYQYRVRSRDAAGNFIYSGNSSFTTDGTAPVISAVTSTAITDTSATITWSTNEASTSQIEFGLTTSYGSSTTNDTTKITSHSQDLTTLTPNTLYHYRVLSTDAAQNQAVSADNVFTTNP